MSASNWLAKTLQNVKPHQFEEESLHKCTHVLDAQIDTGSCAVSSINHTCIARQAAGRLAQEPDWKFQLVIVHLNLHDSGSLISMCIQVCVCVCVCSNGRQRAGNFVYCFSWDGDHFFAVGIHIEHGPANWEMESLHLANSIAHRIQPSKQLRPRDNITTNREVTTASLHSEFVHVSTGDCCRLEISRASFNRNFRKCLYSRGIRYLDTNITNCG